MTNTKRLYSCKDEELVLLSKFTSFSLKRDLPDFQGFSSKFSTEYVANLDAEIAKMENLIQPATETLALKVLSDSLTGYFTQAFEIASDLDGYLRIAKPKLPITKTDFGLVRLRKAINNGDVEAIVKLFVIISQNIENYQSELKEAGMSDDFIANFKGLGANFASNKQQRFEIDSNRKAIVQNNIGVFNGVYEILQEIYAIGKVLYKKTNEAKYKEYTFTELLKKVRNTTKSQSIETKTN